MTEHKRQADGSATRSFTHRVLLGGNFGDSPGQKKWAFWLSHAAYLGCGYCLLRGTPGPGGYGMYFKGYLEPTPYGVWKRGQFDAERAAAGPAAAGEAALGVATLADAAGEAAAGAVPPAWMPPMVVAAGKAFCGDACTHVSDVDQCGRALAVERGTAHPSDVGSNGMSPFIRDLAYTDYNNLFFVPLAHAALCGAVKDFWQLVLSTVKKGEAAQWYQLKSFAKRLIAARARECVPTCGFGRPYSDIVSKSVP